MKKQDALIYSDGACKGNPGPGGWGCVVSCHHNVEELGGFVDATTNNQMELLAALQGLKKATEKQAKSVEVRTDSKYLVQGMTSWIKNWKKKDWKTAQGKPVLNQQLWMDLDVVCQQLDVTWTHVAAHCGIPGNERADEIASSEAQQVGFQYFVGPEADYDVNLSDDQPTAQPVKKIPSKTFKKTSSGTAYCYLSYIDGDLKKHQTWKECEIEVKGRRGARYRKATSEDHMQEVLKSWGL
ncbi:MAG: ribonuclease HI [Oligoflexales bacterium]